MAWLVNPLKQTDMQYLLTQEELNALRDNSNLRAAYERQVADLKKAFMADVRNVLLGAENGWASPELRGMCSGIRHCLDRFSLENRGCVADATVVRSPQ